MTEKTKNKQSSRWFRSENPKSIQITERRLDQLEILYRHRLATTEIFQAVQEGSNKKIQRGLKEFFDAGYIDRPMEQLAMHIKHKGGHGRSEIIYALSDTGMRELQDKRGFSATKTELYRKNKELGETTIFHDVALTKMWACLKTGLEQRRERLGGAYNLILWQQDRPDRGALKTEIVLPNYKKINIIPDSAFKFQCPKSQFLFFVEYYRSRKGGHQAYLDKLKLYNLYFQQKKFAKYEVKRGFRIITLVPSRRIIDNLIKLINSKKNESLQHYRFWFVAEDDYRLFIKERVNNATVQHEDFESVLEPIFRVPIDDELHCLEE